MPEVWDRKLMCDKNDRKQGRAFTISDGRRTMQVILCEKHEGPLLDLMSIGEEVRPTRTARDRRGGLGTERLESLIVTDDDE